MRTIGRAYHGPNRNYAADCDLCGVKWHRSEMTLDSDGFLVCPDDRDGQAATDLDRERAARASEPSTIRGKTRSF